jgi:valyl-tRNA synthetase
MYFSLPPKQKNLYQDSDTLDTWFSSALWPFSTLGWPDESKDFERFYPTDVLETGHDILTFWVLRMIMFGRYATGEYPFHTVYLHGLVCDENGQKMSKSKGNGIDPLEMIEEVGADAVRLSLVIGATPGNPISLGKSKISGYRNFVNKLWNAGRFVRLQNQEKGKSSSSPPPTPQSVADKWILHRLSAVCSAVSKKLEKYEISVAGDMIYHFVWDEFCDWYIEASKVSPNSRFLKYIFLEILKLTHPLCPFVTEALWQELADGSIIEQTFPDIGFQDHLAIQTFENVQKMVTEIRKIRAEKKLNPKERLFVQITGKSPAETIDLIENLAGVECETIDTKNAVKVAIDSLEVFIDVPIDHARIEKEKSVLNKKISSLQARLKNKGYINKAPSKLVEQTKKELEIAKEKLKELG